MNDKLIMSKRKLQKRETVSKAPKCEEKKLDGEERIKQMSYERALDCETFKVVKPLVMNLLKEDLAQIYREQY